ncbi:hypothetical protein BpHYR1_031093 [Brachionus plicatilis]|uniref:Retrotransposon gag domain-containing protein n=1 Tax=Brachionus plicatilis TaxID=10195 RepID=A0A3M7SI28_BRAPC|nr:hypothetical protein BpHYR1_031093 [Brachionus plicatilis]
MDRERKTQEDSSKSWEQIKSMHHMKAKSLAFKLDKRTKIYKEKLESAFSIAISKDEFVDRVKNVEDLKTSLNLKIKDLKSEEQIISSEDKNNNSTSEENEYNLNKDFYKLENVSEHTESKIQDSPGTDEQSSETEDQSIKNKQDYNISMPKTSYCETSFKQTQFAKQKVNEQNKFGTKSYNENDYGFSNYRLPPTPILKDSNDLNLNQSKFIDNTISNKPNFNYEDKIMITKTKRLENSTPKFSGNPRDVVDDWLFMVKQGFISANIEEKMKLNAFVNFVSDLPLLILKKHIESPSNWISFENELKSTFRNINRDQKIRSELISLKNREGLSIENYVKDEKMFRFTQGLKEPSKRELVCRNITKLNSAIPLAIQLESFTNSVAKINYFRNNKSKNNQYNRYNLEKVQNNRQTKYKSDYSRKCKRKGHYANTCRSDLKNINEKIDDLESDKIYVLNDQSSEKKIPSIIGRIEGISMKIGLDSGATHSVMNHMTAISNKFEILRTYKRIKTATGIISEASGVTKPVEVDIGGNKCILEFIVFNHDDHDVLLGIDWFHKTRAGIFPAHVYCMLTLFENGRNYEPLILYHLYRLF